MQRKLHEKAFPITVLTNKKQKRVTLSGYNKCNHTYAHSLVLTINCLHRSQLEPIYPTRDDSQCNISHLPAIKISVIITEVNLDPWQSCGLTSSKTIWINLKESKSVRIISSTGTPTYVRGIKYHLNANASCSGGVVVRQRLALWKIFQGAQENKREKVNYHNDNEPPSLETRAKITGLSS